MKSVKVVVLVLVLIVLFSCSNDSTSSNNELSTYEETGTIGDEGGIVHITDEESEIYGTYVEIPEGALENSVEVTIQQIEEFNFVDTTAIVVDFAPSGTQFSELIEIGIPYKASSDIEKLQLYTYNEDNEAWEVMLIDHIDTDNKLVISKTNHFSLYTAGDYISIMFEANVYKIGNDKIGVHIQAPDFNEIPTRLAYWDDGIYNVEQCIDGDPFENFPKAWFKITVREDTWWTPETYSYNAIFYDRYSQATAFGDWKAEINNSNSNEIFQYNEWLNLNELSDFYSGLPYIIESESFDTSEDFIIIVEFYYSQYTDYSASATLLGRYTPIFSFAIQDIEFNDLSYAPSSLDEDGDLITNDYDVPETEPVIEIVTPSGIQNGNITINYNITDEDGDLNEFGVYYQSTGTGTNLATLLSTSTGSIHNIGFIQNIESGSQSFIWDSFNDFPDNSGLFKIIMSWVDPQGGMPGPVFESDYFQVDNISPNISITSPNGGETWQMGSAYDITWNDNISNNVTLDLYNSGLFDRTISSSTPSDGTYNWSIPADLDESTSYKVKISSIENNSISDFSNNNFTIVEQVDIEPPFIGNIFIPEPGTTVSGIVTIETYATDNVGVTHVVFEVFRNGVGYEEVGIDYTPDANDHFSVEFNSALFENGEHNIHATAYDAAENYEMAGWSCFFLNGTGTVTDIDGNVYQTLVIGNQEWIIENLKVTHYRNGDPIPHVTDNSTWVGLSTGAYCVYANTPANADTYGNLYNWYAVSDPRELAPDGWHVPTDEEIMELEMYLGMSESAANSIGWRGTNEGSKLAGGYDLWQSGSLRNDPEFGTSGFSFLPGGYRSGNYGSFYDLGNYGDFWSATEYNTYYAWRRTLGYYYAEVYRNGGDKRNGYSVRCIRD